MFIEVNDEGLKVLVNSDYIKKIVPAVGDNNKCHLFLEGEIITVGESINSLIEKLNFKAVDEELLLEDDQFPNLKAPSKRMIKNA